MRKPLTISSRIPAERSRSSLIAALLGGALAIAALAASQHADASGAICAAGVNCTKDLSAMSADDRYSHLASSLGETAREESAMHRLELSDQDYSAFSGVGALVCTVDGKSRSSTAFLVGAFDIAVTVAHTFGTDRDAELPTDCVYNSMDSLGQVRERIPVSYIKSEWLSDANAFGQPAKDLAVVRLARPSRYAQRTMPLGKFSGNAAPVVMVGFRADIDADTMKRKARGQVYERRGNGVAPPSLTGFTHDMDSRGIGAGAPVIDERSGVIIGIHTRIDSRRNAMITMNEWLEATLRTEMESEVKSASEPAVPTESRPN